MTKDKFIYQCNSIEWSPRNDDFATLERNSLPYVERDEQHRDHRNLYVGSEIRYTPYKAQLNYILQCTSKPRNWSFPNRIFTHIVSTICAIYHPAHLWFDFAAQTIRVLLKQLHRDLFSTDGWTKMTVKVKKKKSKAIPVTGLGGL
jgi:hypothetical protein